MDNGGCARMTMDERIEELRERRRAATAGGGAARVDRQHARGKLTARERIAYLCDDDSFAELDAHRTHRTTAFGMDETTIPGDGVVTGTARIDDRPVCVFAHDFTVFGGSLGEVVGEKITKLMQIARTNGHPLIGLNDSGGARIQEGVRSLGGFGEIFNANTACSGVIPQLSAIMGPCAGGAVYSPAITDFTFMVEGTSHMFITGPQVIETVTGEEVSFEELGGASTHTERSGVAHRRFDDEHQCLDALRVLLSYLPANNLDRPPRFAGTPPVRADPGAVVPDAPSKPYDMHAVLAGIIDADSLFELQPAHARNLIVGFARLDGQSVGVVANQPQAQAGTLDIDASVKAARFVRFCDSFGIPILTLVDVPGFLPGTDQEHGGIIRHGAKLLFAYAEATVPLLTVITRKAYGGAYDVMASKHLGADVNYAWPTAEIAVMGPQGAVNILYRDELADTDDPDARRAALVEEYREEFANPYTAAEAGFIDAVIEPTETRARLLADLERLDGKHTDSPERRHGNIPL
jgi:acetyl-CoA/propionyl-CoA carboxylase carboxyl transferase subunit